MPVSALPSGSQITVSKHWVWGEPKDTWGSQTPISKSLPFVPHVTLPGVQNLGLPEGRAWAVGGGLLTSKYKAVL